MARFQTSRQRQRKRRQKALIGLGIAGILTAVSIVITCTGSWRYLYRGVGLAHFGEQAKDAPLAVHVLSVGKADAIVVQSGAQAMLIDCGGADDGDTVATYLQNLGISHLTYLVGTHPDSDHLGGYPALLTKISANLYLQPPLTEAQRNSPVQTRALQALQSAKIPIREVCAGQTFALGAATVQVLSPAGATERDNEASLVLRIGCEDRHFLFMGDAGEKTEKQLLSSGADISAEFLKVGHHGSQTATTADFLKAVSPETAAISVAPDSSDLPRDDVLYRLYTQGCSVYRTDTDGNLLFLLEGRTIKTETELS